MTTPFDSTPANPFADTTTPAAQPAAQPAELSPTPTQPAQEAPAINPFADVPTQAAAPQSSPQSPLSNAAPASAPAFGAPPASFGSGNSFGGGSNNGGGRKYKIFDLYWLVNQKLYKQEQLADGEVAVLNISYNVDFDNLRLSFCTPGADTFTATGMELKSMERKTTVNICAEVAEQLTDLIAVESGQVNNLERVFQNNSNWAPNQTTFTKSNNMIQISTKTRNGETYSYVLQEWQLKALNHACIFLLKEARVLALSKLGIG